MKRRLLLDTHILIRWLVEPGRLSRDQRRAIRVAVQRQETLAISAVTLLEIAVIFGKGATRSNVPIEDLLATLESTPEIRIMPLTMEIAAEVAALGESLRDPADRAIVATARVEQLRLVTSDQRIIESKLVPVVA